MNSKFSDFRSVHRSARRQATLGRVLSKYAFGGPLDQAVRWHLFDDGERVISIVVQGKAPNLIWSEGPAMQPPDLGNPDRLQILTKEVFSRLKSSLRNQTSLGVILHLADDFDAGIVQEEFENPELFEQASARIREMPTEVVTDLTTGQDPSIQWRYYPLLSGQRAVVLRHHIEYLAALQALTEADIKVAIHSAPVEMLFLYVKLYAEAIEEKPHCLVFFYDRFTLVVPANQGVLDLKVLPHRQQDVPPGFGDDLFSLLERFGMVNSCVLLLVQCGSREPTLLFRELDSYARRNQKNSDGIDIQIPDQEGVWSVFHEVTPGQIVAKSIHRPEFLTEYCQGTGDFPLSLGVKSDVQRFAILTRETYWPDDQNSRNERLPRSLAFAMTGLRAGKILGVLCLLALGGWLALCVFNASHGDALRLVPEMISGKQAELNQLQQQRLYLSQWDKILSPRSQAWSAMDFFLALLPEGRDVICDRLRYAIKQSALRPGSTEGPGGFLREWTIEGSCTDKGRDHLEKLREGSTVSQIFASMAARLSDPSFGLSENRIIKVVLREETNQQASTPNSNLLPYQFRLVVTQNIQAGDPLAIPLLPKKTGKAAS